MTRHTGEENSNRGRSVEPAPGEGSQIAHRTSKPVRRKQPFRFLETDISPGERRLFNLPAGRLYTGAEAHIPIEVCCGAHEGPVLLVGAAIHGDELNGVEIVRRVLSARWLKDLRGTLIAVPIFNVLGCLNRSRYLPDRRDLNRSFPGSETGNMASRMAWLIREHVLRHADYAIDLHTGAVDRDNLPQIRVTLKNERAARMAEWFGVPVIIDSAVSNETFRGTGDELGIPVITYEGGEALRFNETSINAGVRGVHRVMHALRMLSPRKRAARSINPVIARSSSWVRADEGGFLVSSVSLGARITKGQMLGYITNPLDQGGSPLHSPWSGILIGCSHLPVVHEGEALFHIARFEEVGEAEAAVEHFRERIDEENARHDSRMAGDV